MEDKMTTHDRRTTSVASDIAATGGAFQKLHSTVDRSQTDEGTERAEANARAEARRAADSAEFQAEQRAEELAQQAREATEAAKRKAFDAARAAKESGGRYADEKKRRAAAEIGVLGDAFRKAADKLHEEHHASLASYVEAAAEQLDCLRTSLETKDVGELVDDARSRIRRHPTIASSTLFAAGLAAVRFFKASRSPRNEPVERRNFSDPANRPASAYGHDPTMNHDGRQANTAQSAGNPSNASDGTSADIQETGDSPDESDGDLETTA
jgi:hypothetical protein